jgi:hypothetical protein
MNESKLPVQMKKNVKEFNVRFFEIDDDPEACVFRAVIDTRDWNDGTGVLKHLAIESHPFDNNGTADAVGHKRSVLQAFSQSVAFAIQQKTWPEDTMRYKERPDGSYAEDGFPESADGA